MTVTAERTGRQHAQHGENAGVMPARLRRSPQLGEVLPLLYLSGMPPSSFVSALPRRLGADLGLSTTMIAGLIAQWEDEACAFRSQHLFDPDHPYVWVDAIRPAVRLEQDETCLLIMIGVRSDGCRELIGLADGPSDSPRAWADLLRNCRQRGMTAPALAVGAASLGFWAAARQLFPGTTEQRCWFHRSRDVLAVLPPNLRADAGRSLAEIHQAPDRRSARRAVRSFSNRFGTDWPAAAAKITDDLAALLAFHDFPAQHAIHLRTTKPIESIFGPVRFRDPSSRRDGSRNVGVAMAQKLLRSTEYHWPAINAARLIPGLHSPHRHRPTGISTCPDPSPNGERHG
ncbi:transposase [Microlunatus sp. Gsoil 973]|uniref:IS256 family transposase n=1 Tax=Microlunatus sp. Gsoil 973 TaxID=2672569 RepID=UPI0018A8669D|nr:transposase [Microlunatus sp. Gsoil 973]